MDYRTTLIDSRQGVNLTVQEAKSMASVISPLLKQGHSPYHVVDLINYQNTDLLACL
jgi:IS30 family transposase